MYPIFVRIGNFVIYWYGVLVAIGVFISISVFQKESQKEGFDEKFISQITFWTIIFGIFGARLLHIFVNIFYYILNPSEIFKLRNGGLAIEGAVLSSLIFIVIFTKIKKISSIKILDTMSIAVPIGQSIGRIGCFLNGCCYGKETDFILGIKFPFLEKKVHPTQLYYSFFNILLFIAIKKLSRYFKKGEGILFSTYLIGFSLIRYFVDFLRGDLKKTSIDLYATQIIGIIIFIIGSGVLIFSIIKKDRKHGQTFI
ncbi:MAG: prolipoprotein diacylglyceryl transferase [bacterium]|nr:prolipoprotein diacylglyceryl transferase [bacterium]